MVFLKERAGKLIEDIRGLIYTDITPVASYRMRRETREGEGAGGREWKEITREEVWGGHREYFRFETEIVIPERLAGKCVVYELRTGREGEWDATNPQFSVYVNGARRQGLDVNHREVILTEEARAGERFHIGLSAYTGDNNFRLVMDSCIKALRRETERYYYDASVPYGVARLLPEEDGNRILILRVLNESLNLLDLRKEHSPAYEESLKRAQEYLTKEFYEKYCGKEERKIYCVGHTHIDVAWLWTLSVTEDKAVRSFSTVLELMKRYPEYLFMSSQPQLYKYVRQNAPEVYEQIKSRVREGRWEPEGGMFVEADCNLSSGESLVRQFLHGKRFFREEFGRDNEILWLPDVFGYSAALPQIMKECGIRYFMTTKISWNEFNKMPYDTFEWEGIDGTRILTHFSPSRDYHKAAVEGGTETEHFTTYNAYINPSQVMGAWERYSQKRLNGEALMSFGYGDGGGGPTKDMLENQRRLARGIPGCPATVMSTAKHFFHVLEEHVRDNKYLPVWVGELYLEYHRGTYTSMARNKKYNRRAEFLLQNAELACAAAGMLTGAEYPGERLDGAWERVLRNQFHDILPGSSIKEVYEDSDVEYKETLREGEELFGKALEEIAEKVDASENAVIVFNPCGAPGEGLVAFTCAPGEEPEAMTDGKTCYPVQRCGGRYLFEASGVPGKGYKTFAATADKGFGAPSLSCSDRRLENEFVRVEFSANGQISSIYDKKEDRQLLKSGQNGNVLMTYEDRPHNYDAWDINSYYTEKSWEVTQLEEIRLIESGPVRAAVRVVRRYLDSVITQDISIRTGSPEITIQNEIDWREKQLLLKALFPVDIHTDEASFEIQYGNVTRKTHRNTSWDLARFEVCMHKWLDVSEDGYGVSVLNDCKYGAGVQDGVIGISLIKSAVYPNPDADKERHSFTYAVYPHKGGFREAGTIGRAYALNNPMRALIKKTPGGSLPRSWSAVTADAPNAVIEVVKQAMDGTELIVRLYEAFNRRTPVTLRFGRPVRRAAECNMLEEEKAALAHEENLVSFLLRPYEIKTLKIFF